MTQQVNLYSWTSAIQGIGIEGGLSGLALKVLRVNTGETGLEFGSIINSIVAFEPLVTSGVENPIIQINGIDTYGSTDDIMAMDSAGGQNLNWISCTGTGNIVRADSPAFTGTVTGEYSTWSGSAGIASSLSVGGGVSLVDLGSGDYAITSIVGVGTTFNTSINVNGTLHANGYLEANAALGVAGGASLEGGVIIDILTAEQIDITIQLTIGSTTILPDGRGEFANNVTAPYFIGNFQNLDLVSVPVLGTDSGGLVQSANTVGDGDVVVLQSNGSFGTQIADVSSGGTGTVSWVKTGNTVTMMIPNIVGVSNGSGGTLSNLPSAIRPATTQKVASVDILNEDTFYLGVITIPDSGDIALEYIVVDLLSGGLLYGNPFGSSGSKGIGAISISYILA